MTRKTIIILLFVVSFAIVATIAGNALLVTNSDQEEPGVPPQSSTIIEDTIPPTETESELPPEATEPIDPAPNLEELLWMHREAEYPIATEIWLIMKSYGWSDAACAGIMGNIMREVGGDTLEYIQPDLYGAGGYHFGLCQWSKRYYSEIYPTNEWMPTAREQLDFLRHTILHYNGNGYSYGFTEDYLKTATDCREVAKIFCDGYERPNESPTRRQNNAEKAYNYFVVDTTVLKEFVDYHGVDERFINDILTYIPNVEAITDYRVACWTFFFVMEDGTEYVAFTDYDGVITSISTWEEDTTGSILYNKGE